MNDFGVDYTEAWEEDTGYPLAILYDRRNVNEFKVYPVPDESILGIEYQFINNNLFGVITSLQEFSVVPSFGVTVSTEGDANIKVYEVEPIFGVTTDIDDFKGRFKCYYLRIPPDLTSVTDTLLTPPMLDTALKYYVIGHAFLNDLNETYQSKGAQQLQFYQRELAKAVETSSIDSTRAAQSDVAYMTPFR